jgi:hypothetical protein
MAAPSFSSTNHPSPAEFAVEVTASDSSANNLIVAARGLYVGGGGNAVVVTPDGEAVTFLNLVTGSVLPVRFVRVNSTNTTATGLVALF